MKPPAFIHSLLGVYIPVMFFAVMLLVLANSLLLPAGIRVFPPPFALLILFTGAFETVAAKLVHKRQPVPISRRLRQLIIFIIVSFLLVLLLCGNDLAVRSVARVLALWVPVLFLTAQWLLGAYLHRLLFTRERFVGLFTGVDAQKLREIYSSHSHEAAGSIKAISALKRTVCTLTGLGFAGFTVTSWMMRIGYTGWALFLVLLFFVSSVPVIGMLNGWREMQLMAADGLIPVARERRSRALAGLLLVGAAILIAVPAAGGEAPLPARYLDALASWLEKLGTFEFARNAGEAPAFGFSMTQNPFDTLLDVLEPQEAVGSALTERTMRIAGWILLGVLGAGMCTYLLLPLFRSNREITGLRAGVENARAVIADLRGAIASLRKRFRNWLKATGAWRLKRGSFHWERLFAGGDGERAAEERAKATSPVQRRPDDNTVKAYYRKFIRFGEKRGAVFAASLAPGEYASKVAELAPECAQACEEIAAFFEEAAYSNHRIEDTVRLRFKKVVKQVIKTRRSRG